MNSLTYHDMYELNTIYQRYVEALELREEAEGSIKSLKKLLPRFVPSLPEFEKNVELKTFLDGRFQSMVQLYVFQVKPLHSDIDVDEFDIHNEAKFDWRKFREEMVHHRAMGFKDINSPIGQVLFNMDFDPLETITFQFSMDHPVVLANALGNALLVNYPVCPHEIKVPVLETIEFGGEKYENYLCPSLRLTKRLELLDKHSKPTKTAQTGRPSELILNPRGLELLRSLIYSQFIVAIRNKYSALLIVGFAGCSNCKIHNDQVGHLYREAASVFAGRGLTKVYFFSIALHASSTGNTLF